MFCRQCGRTLPDGSRFCNGCGAEQNVREPASPAAPADPDLMTYRAPQASPHLSPLSGDAALMLGVLFGLFGGHAFYAGHTRTALIKLGLFLVGISFIASLIYGLGTLAALQGILLGAAVIWWIVDIIILCVGAYKDADGKRISKD